MKKFIYIIVLVFSAWVQAMAQPPGGGDPAKREEKVQALYVAFITRELQLTEEEAQKFWPVHAQYENEMKATRREMPELERQEAHLNIRKKYQERFVKILGNARTDEFYKKDNEFRRQMVERLKKLRQQRAGGGGARLMMRDRQDF